MPDSPLDPRDWPIPPMDKRAGHKDTAFTWAMGHLILARIWLGEPVKTITADPRMPAYCTVFRWMQVVPEFGEAVADLRAKLAEVRTSNRDLKRRQARQAAQIRGERRRRGPRRTGNGSAQALDRTLARIRDGASVTEALAACGAPTAKMFYTRVRACPGFRAAFADVCDWRNGWLGFEAELVVDEVGALGIPGANAKIARLKARRGRLTPKLYRAPPPGARDG